MNPGSVTGNRLLLLLFLLLPFFGMAQEIRGLKVYVDIAAGTYLKFPKPLDGIEGNFREKGYNFKNRPGSNAINIIPPTDRPLERAEIEISEGGRNHLFIITPYPKKYDPNIDPPFEYIADNSDKLKKFAQQAEQDRINNAATPENTQTAAAKPAEVPVPEKPKPAEVKPPEVKLPVSDGYDEAVAAGDKAFNDKNYHQAKVSYTEALRIRVNEKYPFNRIQLIVKLEEDEEARLKQEEERQKSIDAGYTQELQKADRLLLNGEYSLARASYGKALEIKSTETYPKNKIVEIDSLVKDLLAKQEAQRLADAEEKKRVAAEQELNNRYNTALSRADKAFAAGKYDEARIAYSDAQKIKPGEKYPDQKLTEIAEVQNAKETAAAEKLLKDREAELTGRYNAFITKGDKAFSDKQYDAAKTAYNSALALKPSDKNATDKITRVDDAIAAAKAAEAEKASLAKQKAAKDAYNAAIVKADKAFAAKNFETAKTEYYNAQKIMPAETYPQTQLNIIDSQLAAAAAKIARDKEIAANYTKAITTADKAFAAKNYTDAKVAYTEALGIKDGDAYARGKIAAIEKIEEELSIKASQAAEKALNDRYDAAVAIADKQFADKDYVQAKESYLKAIDIIPNKSYPNNQVKLIERKQFEQAEQEKTDKFNGLVSLADKAFSAKSYNSAKDYYTQALAVKPDEAYPKKQIDIINDPGELERIGKRDEFKLYNQLVDEGDKAFKAGKYQEAKTSYRKALDIKPEVPYLVYKMSQIEDAIAAEAAADKVRKQAEEQKIIDDKFNAIVANASAAYDKGDMAGAKKLYTDALEVKPGDAGVKERITGIDKKIAQAEEEAAALKLAKQKEQELNERYAALVQKADKAYNAKQYADAKAGYDSAVLLKPDDKYTRGRLEQIEKDQAMAADSLKDIEASKLKKEEADANYNAAIERAGKALDSKLYYEAKAAYNDALAIKPGESLPKNKLAEIEKALAKEAATAPAETPKAETAKTAPEKNTPAKPEPVKTDIAKPTGKGTVAQPLALPYNQAELYRRYNTFNFREPPVGQKYVADAFFASDTLENYNLSRAILAEAPRLDISDSSDNIKVTLQAINFEGSSAFLKLRIQNFSTKEYLTGRMLFTWFRKNDPKVDYYATYISAFPYLLPGKEFTIIYATRAANPSPGEEFTFTLDDRLRTVKLELKIPSEVYNAEYDR